MALEGDDRAGIGVLTRGHRGTGKTGLGVG